MFDQQKAPLRVLDQPILGEPVMMLSEPAPSSVPSVRIVLQQDPRIDRLQQQLDRLIDRVQQLESQTLAAYWSRVQHWIHMRWQAILSIFRG